MYLSDIYNLHSNFFFHSNFTQNKIRRVHLAAREGSLRDLQSALDRRKFAVARDDCSPGKCTPIHVATIFGHASMS